jgi:sugar lactone lactonase YvrE
MVRSLPAAWLVAFACVEEPIFIAESTASSGGTTASGGGGGSSECAVDHADCNRSPSDGCEVHLPTDPEHCGACGHGCDGPCAGSACQPVEIVGGEKKPRGIAVDAEYVYWVTWEGHEVKRAPKAGGTVDTLATGQLGAWMLAIDDTHLYWTARSAGTVAKMAKVGGGVTVLASMLSDPTDLALDGADVYYVDWGSGNVHRVGKDGLNAASLATVPGDPVSLAVTRDAILLAGEDSGDVVRLTKAGGELTLGFDGTDPAYQIRVNATTAFWCGQGDGRIWSLALADLVPTMFGDGTKCFGIAVDDDHVYWTNERSGTRLGEVRMKAIAGGQERILATEQSAPTNITYDDVAVYWSNYGGGSIMRVNK